MFKDSETKKKYFRELMARRRAEAKGQVLASLPDSGAGNLETAQPVVPVQVSSPASANTAPLGAASKPRLNPAAGIESPQVKAAKVVELTEEWLATRGWVIWECSLLNNDWIVIIRDEMVKDYPPGYPVYTEFDLKKIADLPDSTIRLIHATKKKYLGQLVLMGDK